MEDKGYEPALLRALDNISAAMQAQAEQMSRVVVKLDDTHGRVIRLESAKHDRETARLEKSLGEHREEVKGAISLVNDRLQTLELANANFRGEMSGASKLANIVRLTLPIGAVVFFGLAAYLVTTL